MSEDRDFLAMPLSLVTDCDEFTAALGREYTDVTLNIEFVQDGQPYYDFVHPNEQTRNEAFCYAIGWVCGRKRESASFYPEEGLASICLARGWAHGRDAARPTDPLTVRTSPQVRSRPYKRSYPFSAWESTKSVAEVVTRLYPTVEVHVDKLPDDKVILRFKSDSRSAFCEAQDYAMGYLRGREGLGCKTDGERARDAGTAMGWADGYMYYLMDRAGLNHLAPRAA